MSAAAAKADIGLDRAEVENDPERTRGRDTCTVLHAQRHCQPPCRRGLRAADDSPRADLRTSEERRRA